MLAGAIPSHMQLWSDADGPFLIQDWRMMFGCRAAASFASRVSGFISPGSWTACRICCDRQLWLRQTRTQARSTGGRRSSASTRLFGRQRSKALEVMSQCWRSPTCSLTTSRCSVCKESDVPSSLPSPRYSRRSALTHRARRFCQRAISKPTEQ